MSRKRKKKRPPCEDSHISFWRNSEGYRDPTAGQAMKNISIREFHKKLPARQVSIPKTSSLNKPGSAISRKRMLA